MPGALRPVRRPLTARAVAEKIGKSERTVRRYFAEPRAEYTARAAERHERIRLLRKEGKTYRAIAAELGVSVGTVQYAIHKETGSAS